MIADDCADNRELLRTVLSLDGYEVVEAANGLEAVETARCARPDLIFMDLNMPVLDGYDAVLRLRQTPETSHVPVVAFTSNDTSEHRAKALAVGFNEFLTKPIDWPRLERVVCRLLKAA